MRGMFFSVLAALGVLAVQPAAAAEYPTKPIDMIVPYTAGGPGDLGARVIARALEGKWKVPVRVVNMPGGNTVPGLTEVLQSPPDGYKVLFDMAPSSSILSIVVPDLPFKPTERTFMTFASEAFMFVAVAEDSPYKTLDDLMSAARKNPERITWAALGGTGVPVLAIRKLFKNAGVDVTKTRSVAFKGSPESAAAVAGGHVVMGAGSYTAYAPFLAAKKARFLAAFGDRRSRFAPDVPTTVELGYPNTEAGVWMGFSGPMNVPKDVVNRWETTVREIMSDPQVVAALANSGNDVLLGSGEEMRRKVEDESKSLAEFFTTK